MRVFASCSQCLGHLFDLQNFEFFSEVTLSAQMWLCRRWMHLLAYYGSSGKISKFWMLSRCPRAMWTGCRDLHFYISKNLGLDRFFGEGDLIKIGFWNMAILPDVVGRHARSTRPLRCFCRQGHLSAFLEVFCRMKWPNWVQLINNWVVHQYWNKWWPKQIWSQYLKKLGHVDA